MLRSDIVHSCSNAAVAAGALRSLGPDFERRFNLLAGTCGMSAGAYTASLVSRFEAEASEDDWYTLGVAIARRDMPVLAGFRFILETMTDARTVETSPRPAQPGPRACGRLGA